VPWRKGVIILLAAFLAAISTNALAQVERARFDVLEDAHQRLKLNDLLKPTAALKWRRLPKGRLSGGISNSAWWLRTVVPVEGAKWARRILAVGSPTLDHVEFYIVRDGKLVRSSAAGETLPFSGRHYPARRIVFPIEASDAGASIYLRITSKGWASAHPQIWSEAAFLAQRADQSLIDGFYYGALGFVIIFNFFLFFGFRDTVFLSYAAMMAALMMFTAKLDGYPDQLLWPGWPDIANPAGATLGFLVTLIPCQFVRQFLQLPVRQPVLDKICLGLMALVVLGILAQPIITFGTALLAAVGVGLLGILLWVTAIVRAVVQGYTPAVYLLVGQFLIAPATAVMVLRLNGILETSLWTSNALEIALAGEAIMISLGLSARVAHLRRDKQRVERTLAEERSNVAERLVEAQEEEKRRISADLHDSVGQSLLAIANQLKMLAGRQDSESREIGGLAQNAQHALDEVRHISHELHPHQVMRVGLVPGLRDLVRRLFDGQDVSVLVDLDPEIDKAIPPREQLQLFRSVQAALANCANHACSSNLSIIGRAGPTGVDLTVVDNGIGFSTEGSKSNGIGLQTMMERMSLIGGRCEINSTAGAGTRVQFHVPNGG
jgi:signal transduction histidine kinase